MRVDVVLDMPSAAEYAEGEFIAVVAGAYAGLWERHTPTYPSRWTGSYVGTPGWRKAHGPEALALAEMADLAETARYWAGIEASRRAVWPGPTPAADTALEAAIEARTGSCLPR